MIISLKLNNDDAALFKKYAKMHNMPLSDFIRNAVLEKIEDEYDIAVTNEAYKEYLNSGCKSTPVADFWRELELDKI